MQATPVATAAPAVELDYIAVCIAEQVVRIKLAAAQRQQTDDQAQDTSSIVTRPLMALAKNLGIQERVRHHVAYALPGAIL